MNRLEKLIDELCPEGVEFKSLGDICEIRSGWGFPNVEQGKSTGDYPFYKVGDMNLVGNEFLMNIANNYIDIDISKKLGCKPAPAGTIIFPKIGAAIGTNKKRSLTQPSCYDNNVVGIIPSETILSRFLFYQFEAVDLMSFADYSGAMPSIRKTTLEKFQIPLPPLPVQQEIVRILDNFTELTAELTAELASELTARKKQYGYYRNMLLNFNEERNVEVQWATLGDVCENIASGNNKSRNESGEFPVYGSTGIIAYSDSYKYNEDLLLVARVGANAGFVHRATGQFDVSDNTLIVKPKEGYNLSFAYYQLLNMKLNDLAVGGGQPLITAGKLKQIKIPVPPAKEQMRVVAILERFDALCNDLTSGLPAEIAARKSQYEYYRDKLLTFKEASA